MRLTALAALAPAALAALSATAADTPPPSAPVTRPDQLQEVVIFARGENLIGKADGGQRRRGRRRRPVRAAPAPRGRTARSGARPDRRPALRQRQGEPVLPARLQPRPRHGLHDLHRRRADEPAHARPRPGLPRRERPDPGDRGARGLPQGALPRGRRRLRARRRGVHVDHRAARCAVHRARERAVRLAARGRRSARTNLGGGELTLVGQWKAYDGPWELPEHLRHESVWGKYAQADVARRARS